MFHHPTMHECHYCVMLVRFLYHSYFYYRVIGGKLNESISYEWLAMLIFSTDSNQRRGNVGELAICYLDLCKLKSIRECAKYLLTTESAIHLLINNAGVMMSPYEKTEDGFELQLQSNYLGHFLLTLLLLPRIQSSAPGCRIINVASLAYIRESK